MYLTERIIGIITYMIIMLIIIFLIYKSKSKKKLKHYLIIYWFLLAIMAFFYIPAESADLYRLFDVLHKYSQYGLEDLFSAMGEVNVPSQCLYFWIIGKIGIDGLLPAITSMIFFGNVFYIVYKCACKYELDNKNVAISLLLFMEMGKFLEVVSGIRSLMAFSIIALCVYKEIIENKKIYKNIVLYIFAAFMHPAAMILTLIRFLLLLLQKENNTVKKIFNIFLGIILLFVAYKFAGNIIESATNKAESYMGHKAYSYIWEYLISWAYVIFSTFSIIKYNKVLQKQREIKNIKMFVLIFNIIIVLLCFEYSIFTRFQTFSSILFIPVFAAKNGE